VLRLISLINFNIAHLAVNSDVQFDRIRLGWERTTVGGLALL
jgi:hypothetical protein